MTKKDYIVIAGAFSEAYTDAMRNGGGLTSTELQAVGVAMNMVADALKADNPRFDRNRFASACLPTEIPCAVCSGKRDVEAIVCSKC